MSLGRSGTRDSAAWRCHLFALDHAPVGRDELRRHHIGLRVSVVVLCRPDEARRKILMACATMSSLRRTVLVIDCFIKLFMVFTVINVIQG